METEQHLYLVRLNPDEGPPTYKVGKSQNVEKRVRSMRTIAPRAELVTRWGGLGYLERQILLALKRFDKTARALRGETVNIWWPNIRQVGQEVFRLQDAENGAVASGDGGMSDDAYFEMVMNDLIEENE